MLAFGDSPWQITIDKRRKPASNEQRGVLHWYCAEMAKYLGMEMLEFKAVMAYKYLRRVKQDEDGNDMFDPETGEQLMYTASTEDLDSSEKFEFTEKIRMWCLEYHNYELPLPDKNWKLFKQMKQQNGG